MKQKIGGATKLYHIEGAVKSAGLVLTAEEPYVPHALVGVMV